MLGNLLDNAGKWADSTVTLSIKSAGMGDFQGRNLPVVQLLIEDDGPGLSDSQCKEAVQRGARLDESKPGSGLGLSIVRDLVELYGGSFSLSRSKLGGLRAELLLPGAA